MNKFSESSLKKLGTCDERLQQVMNAAIIDSPIDFGIIYGIRTPEEQYELYKQGRTKQGNIVTYKDGYRELSTHNYSPSKACDIACFVDGKLTWDTKKYIEVAAHIKEKANELGIKIFWGGDFKTFKDYPHYQID